MKVAADTSSSASPGTVASEELTSFLGVPGLYLVGAEPSKQMHLYIHI